MNKGIRISGAAFSDSVQASLRASGYSQKELAEKIGLNAKVLSRKLSGNGNSHLTHLEVRSILIELTRWHAITTQDEVLHLLELAKVGPTLFDAEEWRTAPLNQLEAKRTHATPLDDASIPTSTFQHNLPAPTTRLIGREWAVERLRSLFKRGDVRLVTLVGSGGSGKTRLALHVGNELVSMFEQGVWFVALAGVSDPALVPMSIIQALNMKLTPGVSPMQGLRTYLRSKHLLLLLDNFEQVEAAANVVDELLAAAPGLKVLVTSRSMLHLSGEHALGIPPLDVPEANVVLAATEFAHYEAIQLFVERTQAVMPDFRLTDANKAVIAQICAKVDGLPLALELAAARVRVLSPALLLERLANARLPILIGGARNLPGRQRTLRNTIMWSYDLLSPDEQVWFPRLGIFRRSWSLEAAEAMMPCATSDQRISLASYMLDMIEQLTDNSLLVRLPDANEQSRFTMLETLREYAWEQLTMQGGLEQWQDWHACYYLRLAEAAEQGLRGPQQLVWLGRVATDLDNFRAALEWLLQRANAGMRISIPSSLAQEAVAEYWDVAGSKTLSAEMAPGTGRLALELCLRLAAALRPYWEWQGYLTEGRDWLRAALATPLAKESGATVHAARAKALSEMARLVCLQDEQIQAVELAEASLLLWRQLDDASGLATALLHRGWATHAMNEYDGAKPFYEEGVQHLAATDETWLRAQLLFYLGAVAGFKFDFEQMRSLYTQSRILFEQVGDKSAVADVLKDQGGMLILESNYAESITCLLRSISLCKELGHKQYLTTGMCLLGFAVGMREKPDPIVASLDAAKIQGAAQGLMDAIGLTPWTRTNPFAQMIHYQIRSRVDEQSWEAAWAIGRALSAEQAIALAYQLGNMS